MFPGPRFTLLAFGDTPLPRLPEGVAHACRIGRPGTDPRAADLTDTAGHAHRAYADRGLFLVRPDGHVASATHDPDHMTAYLSWQDKGVRA